MVKIKRKKLFEDDFNTQNQQQVQQPAQQPAQQTTQQSTQQTAQQPAQQPQQQVNQQQPQQPTDQNQQPQQQVQQDPQQQQKQQETQQKVAEIMKNMENTYWSIAYDVPSEIQKALPDFNNNNQEAQPIIKLWDDFKKAPDQNKYTAFINAFKQFGVPQQQQQQQNVNASYQLDIDFRTALHENLKRHNTTQGVEDYINMRNW